MTIRTKDDLHIETDTRGTVTINVNDILDIEDEDANEFLNHIQDETIADYLKEQGYDVNVT